MWLRNVTACATLRRMALDDEAIKKSLGNALKTYRQKAGYNQREAAKIMGLSHGTISHWERGKRTPSAVDVANAAHAYEVDPGALYAESIPTPEPETESLEERVKRLERQINLRQGRGEE